MADSIHRATENPGDQGSYGLKPVETFKIYDQRSGLLLYESDTLQEVVDTLHFLGDESPKSPFCGYRHLYIVCGARAFMRHRVELMTGKRDDEVRE